MRAVPTDLDGLLVFETEPHRDDRGFFTRTGDVEVLAAAGIDPTGFKQDSQSRSFGGVVRGMHGRSGSGEAKLVRCAHGAIMDVVIDARPHSATFGQVRSFRLDDDEHRQLYIPRGFLHGFESLSPVSDVCYRIDAFYTPGDDITVRFDDPELAIQWQASAPMVSDRDRAGASWNDYARSVGRS